MPEWRLALATKGSRLSFYIYIGASFNLILQAVLTLAAFESLVATTDFWNVSVVPPGEGLGLLACGWCAITTASTRYEHDRHHAHFGGESSGKIKPHTRAPYPVGSHDYRHRQPAWQRRRLRHQDKEP